MFPLKYSKAIYFLFLNLCISLKNRRDYIYGFRNSVFTMVTIVINLSMSIAILSPTNFFLGGQQNQVCASVRLSVRPSVCPSVRLSVRPSVRPGRYLTNDLTLCSEILPIYLLPLCHVFSQVSENQNQKYQTLPQSSFQGLVHLFKKSYKCGKRCPNFQFFQICSLTSVPCFHPSFGQF